jgi:hypothetical protein
MILSILPKIFPLLKPANSPFLRNFHPHPFLTFLDNNQPSPYETSKPQAAAFFEIRSAPRLSGCVVHGARLCQGYYFKCRS